MQTTLFYLGLLTFPTDMLMGLGIMLAAGEVPKIAQQFGMDTSTKFNMMSVVHAATTAINLTHMVANPILKYNAPTRRIALTKTTHKRCFGYMVSSAHEIYIVRTAIQIDGTYFG